MTKRKPTHYETLEVDVKANADEIKKAYRRKAKAAHPDHGGKPEQMTALATAYKTLNDPSTRAEYDRTGCDQQQTPIETEVRNLVISAFEVALSSAMNGGEGNIPEIATRFVIEKYQAIKFAKAKNESSLNLLRKQRSRVKKKDGLNLFHELINQHESNIQGVIEQNNRLIEICERAMNALDDYKFSGRADAVDTSRRHGFLFDWGVI